MSLPRVLIVDDHRVVVDGLVLLLGEQFEVVQTVTDARAALDAVLRLHPDIVIIDLSMPHLSGFEIIRQIAHRCPHTKAIVLTMHADGQLAMEAIRLGAAGFVLKEASGEELVTALGVVLRGGTYLASAVTKEVLTLMAGAAEPGRVELTAPQREVLRLLVQGQRAKEIAATLELSTRTVESIKYKAMHALNVHSTAELVRYVVEHRLVPF
jgi:DNA-binding NarL/FixJ family response regulator